MSHPFNSEDAIIFKSRTLGEYKYNIEISISNENTFNDFVGDIHELITNVIDKKERSDTFKVDMLGVVQKYVKKIGAIDIMPVHTIFDTSCIHIFKKNKFIMSIKCLTEELTDEYINKYNSETLGNTLYSSSDVVCNINQHGV